MIHGIVGLMSSGKTLYMTKLLFEDYIKGREIITNYNVNFPHYKINRDFLVNMATQELNLNNVSMGLDEFHVWIDSRSSYANRIISYFLTQTSKDDINLYATSQDNIQMDIRFRRNLHKLSNCSRKIKYNGKYINVPKAYIDERILPDFLNERLYIKINPFRKENIGIYTDLMPLREKYLKASLLFSLFNTRQKQIYNKK